MTFLTLELTYVKFYKIALESTYSPSKYYNKQILYNFPVPATYQILRELLDQKFPRNLPQL